MSHSKIFGSWILPTRLSAAFFMGSGLAMLVAPDQVINILHAQPLGSSQARMYLRLAGVTLAIVGGHQLDATLDNLEKFARYLCYGCANFKTYSL